MKKVALELNAQLVATFATILRSIIDGTALTGDDLIDIVALEMAEKYVGKVVIVKPMKVKLLQSHAYALREIIGTNYCDGVFENILWRKLNNQVINTEQMLLISNEQNGKNH